MTRPDYIVILEVVPVAETCYKGIKCYTSEFSFLWFILENPKWCLVKHRWDILYVNPIKDVRWFDLSSTYNKIIHKHALKQIWFWVKTKYAGVKMVPVNRKFRVLT